MKGWKASTFNVPWALSKTTHLGGSRHDKNREQWEKESKSCVVKDAVLVEEQVADRLIPPYRWPKAIQEPSRLRLDSFRLVPLFTRRFLSLVRSSISHGRYLPVNMSPSPEFSFFLTNCL